MYTEKILTDIIFIVEGNEFQAHRSILIAGCKYFENLSRDLLETKKIEIIDLKASVFKGNFFFFK